MNPPISPALPAIAPAIAELFKAIGLTIGAVNGGVVIAAGIVLVGGIYYMAKKGEKIKDIEKTKTKRKQYYVCCCNKICGSGEYMRHNIMSSSRKKTEDRARHFQFVKHYHDKLGGPPHFHPTKNGVKISGYHFHYKLKTKL